MEYFLLNYLKDRLPGESDLVQIILQREVETRRNLRVLEEETNVALVCSGEAVFSQRSETSLPATRKIDQLIFDAFSESQSKNQFLVNIRETGSITLQAVADITLQKIKLGKSGRISIHVIVVVVGVCLTFIGVVLSLAIRHSNKKAAQKRFEVMTSNGALFPELEEDVEKIVVMEPKPINISNDKEACERMVMRSIHNKSIAALANDKFYQSDEISPSPREKIVGFALNSVSFYL